MSTINPRRCDRSWTLEQCLAHRSVRDEKTGCILWAGTLAPTGYGMLAYRKQVHYAHRAAWSCRNGPIPAGLYVCHRCDVRACINPDHLFLGTARQNSRDAAEKGRFRHDRDPSKSNRLKIHFQGVVMTARVLSVRPEAGWDSSAPKTSAKVSASAMSRSARDVVSPRSDSDVTP
jgi:hypothetical protein